MRLYEGSLFNVTIQQLSLLAELNVRSIGMCDGDLSGHCGSINTLENPLSLLH